MLAKARREPLLIDHKFQVNDETEVARAAIKRGCYENAGLQE